MTKPFGRRPLAFEPMEQRLALSATSVVGYTLEFDLSLVTQGGGTTIQQPGLWLSAGDSLGPTVDFIDLRNGESVFTGPTNSRNIETGDGEVGSLINPITQPQMGEGEIGDGTIAVAEIFRPTQPVAIARADSQLARIETAEPTVEPSNDSWRSISLSRGRDVYFEVASLPDHAESSPQAEPGLTDALAPVLYEQTALRREAQRSTTTAAEENKPVLPSLPERKATPAEAVDAVELPTVEPPSDKSDQTAERNEADNEQPIADVDREQAFADLDEEMPLDDPQQVDPHQNNAAWPALAALAATGWWARFRRPGSTPPSDRHPPRRRRIATRC